MGCIDSELLSNLQTFQPPRQCLRRPGSIPQQIHRKQRFQYQLHPPFNALGKVSPEAKKAFFQWLVDRGGGDLIESTMLALSLGNGMWKDPSQELFLVLWKTIPQWTETIVQWVHDFGLEDSVMTVDEISHGEETAGSELEGLDREIIIHAIRELEKRGKAKLFQGSSQDDIGIKFFK